jgi:hypothetical protein
LIVVFALALAAVLWMASELIDDVADVPVGAQAVLNAHPLGVGGVLEIQTRVPVGGAAQPNLNRA